MCDFEMMFTMDQKDLERLKRKADEAAARAMREASKCVQLSRDIEEQLARYRSTQTERTSECSLPEIWVTKADLPGAA